MKPPQWEVLGHLREGDIVGCDHSTAVQFQHQLQHTIRFVQPLSAFTGFFILSREKKTFPFKDVHVPPVEKDH
jgi:hypothetical protein